MNLYFARHGEAENTVPDEKRKLSGEGKKIIKKSCGLWKNYVDGFDAIISSPLIRAVETGEIIKSEFESNTKILTDGKLRPGCRSESIIELANSLNSKSIIFIGHQPDFGQIISQLISVSEVSMKIKAGAFAKISFEGKAVLSKGRLEFLLPPVF